MKYFLKGIIAVIAILWSANVSAQSINIDTNSRQQKIEGWGVSLCWWANKCGEWDDEKIDTILDWLVSPDGLNYNVFRYNIGGGEDPENAHCEPHHMGKGKGLRAEMPGFKSSADAPYDWSQDAAQRKIMLKIREKRPDAVFEAFSNTPPYYMTVSGCCAGNVDGNKDNLRKECYEDFAHYLVDVCKHYKEEYGIEFATLEPFNEAFTNYWHQNGSQEGCHFDIESQIEFVKVIAPILKSSGLKTILSVSDETDVRRSLMELKAFMADEEAFDLIGQWNTHTYGASVAERLEMHSLISSTGKRFWMSETGSGGDGITGNLNMARRLFDDVRLMQPTVWCDWQYVEERGDQWDMVLASFADQTFSKVRNYYVRQQITSHIPQGYTILQTIDSDVLAAISPDADKLIVVAINNTDETIDKSVSIAGSNYNNMSTWRTSETENHSCLGQKNIKGNAFSISLPGKSITTIELR